MLALSGADSVEGSICSKPAEEQPPSSPPPVSISIPLFLAHEGSLSTTGANGMTRWLPFCLGRAPHFVFLSAGRNQHLRRYSIFSGLLLALRYTLSNPLRLWLQLLRTAQSKIAVSCFGQKRPFLSFSARRRHRPSPPARSPPLGPAHYLEPSHALTLRRRGRSHRRQAREALGFFCRMKALCRNASRQDPALNALIIGFKC